MTKPTVIDLFAGAGGLSCGFEEAGFKCVLGVDANKHAMETFKRNHKHAEVYCGDIAKLSHKKIKELIGSKTKVNVIVGGPPCQGFSTVGPGNPEDDRNSLFKQFVRIVREMKPDFIVIENVTGLVAKKNEKTLKSIFRCFNRLGYHMDVKVMAAQQYGVPEKRRRTIIIGNKLSDQISYPEPSHDTTKKGKYIPPMTVGEALKNLKAKNGKIFNHDLETAKLKSKLEEKRIKNIPEGKGIRYKRDEEAFFSTKLKLNVDWEQLPENRFRQTKYQRLDRKLPSPTIMTHRHTYYHPIKDRFLTSREAAALQSFPNDFEFLGPLSAQWRQIGNAVPPKMAKAIAKTILKMYRTAAKESSSKKKISVQKITSIRSQAFQYKKSPNG